MKGLRQAVNRVARYGYTARFLDPARLDPHDAARVAELMTKSRRGEQERGFSMMLGRLFDPRDTGLLLTLVEGPDGSPVAMCQFVPSPAIGGYSLDLMRRDPGDHPNGLLDFALCSTIAHLKEMGMKGLSLNFAAMRSILEGETGDGMTQRVERWALRRLSGVLQIETLWRFNAKYEPRWLPRYIVFDSAEQFVPVAVQIMRAESLTEVPVIGRLLTTTKRSGPAVPESVQAVLAEGEPNGRPGAETALGHRRHSGPGTSRRRDLVGERSSLPGVRPCRDRTRPTPSAVPATAAISAGPSSSGGSGRPITVGGDRSRPVDLFWAGTAGWRGWRSRSAAGAKSRRARSLRCTGAMARRRQDRDRHRLGLLVVAFGRLVGQNDVLVYGLKPRSMLPRDCPSSW